MFVNSAHLGFFISTNMIKKLRLNIASSLFGDTASLKAIAFVLFFYHKHQGNVLKRWSYNKLKEITGVHPVSIKKRVQSLREMGYVKEENGSLVFLSVVSKHIERNINISEICYDTIKDVEKSLYAVLLCIVQSRKDFCKRTIRQAHNARQYDVVKKAMSVARKYGWTGSYVEKGLSYKRIATFLSVSLKSAFEYVKYAVKKGFLLVENHLKPTYIHNVNHYPIPGYCFTTKNYAYTVGANTYSITSKLFDTQIKK